MMRGYKKNGVLLSLPWDAAAMLVERGLGDFDAMGDGSGIGIAVPGKNVGECFPGESPVVVLEPGGFVVRRGDRDEIVGRRRITDLVSAVEPW